MKSQSSTKDKNTADEALELLRRQQKEWAMCGTNYENLAAVLHRDFSIGFSTIRVQSNPGRLTSTSAAVDKKSIAERKCFLCAENRPAEQRGLPFGEDYTILVNPFPIFPEHFTITNLKHKPQEIESNFPHMLSLTKAMGSRYVVFYNGPRCGASAPDHLHFQAGNLGFMPIEKDLPVLKRTAMAAMHIDGCSLFFCNGALRKFLVIEGVSEMELSRLFALVMNCISDLKGGTEEPMINILGYHSAESGTFTLILFMREKHRPAAYFKEGEGKLMLSPASVDLGGVCILPRAEDYEKITSDDLSKIFKEVFVSEEFLRALQDEISIKY